MGAVLRCNLESCERNRREATVVVGAVLRDLQNHRLTRLFRGQRQGFGRFEVHHVEGGRGGAALLGAGKQLSGVYEGHVVAPS